MATKNEIDVGQIILSKLTAPNICFFFGAGSSKCVGYPLMTELTEIVTEKAKTTPELVKTFSLLTGRTIEEQLEELYGQLRSPGLSQVDEVILIKSVNLIQDTIFEECTKEANLDHHKLFVNSIMRRASERKRYFIFTTNYDMLFEWACDEERVPCINGFFGVQNRMFDANQFDIQPARIITRGQKTRFTLLPCLYLYKMHGSVSWINEPSTITEIKVLPGSKRKSEHLMVFPTPQKFSDTWRSPYIDIFTRMGNILNRKQTVMISLGFSFADSHIYPIIDHCLKDKTFILVILSKDMLISFEPFLSLENVIIVTESQTMISGKSYQLYSNLWDFGVFTKLFYKS